MIPACSRPPNARVEVEIAGTSADSELDGFVTAQPSSTVFQTSAWRDIVTSTYGHRSFTLAARRHGSVCGILTLFLIDSRLFGRMLATSPFGTAGGVCAADDGAAVALVNYAIQLATKLRVRWMELKNNESIEHSRLRLQTNYVDYRLNLTHPDVLWKESLKTQGRNKCRKALNYGLACERGPHLLDDFYHILAVNMRRLGTPMHSREFFANILEKLENDAEVLIARHNGTAIACILLLRHRDHTASVYSSSLPRYLRLNPNNFLYWEAIKLACAHGAGVFKFGRSLAGSGTAHFKESWGATSEPLYYQYYLNRARSIPSINQSNPRLRIATAAWRHLPLRVTTALGPHLIRNVP